MTRSGGGCRYVPDGCRTPPVNSATPLTGHHFISGVAIPGAGALFEAHNPATGAALAPQFFEATAAQADQALAAADAAFATLRVAPRETIAGFLTAVAEEIEALGDALLERAHAETALPMARLTGERARTVNAARAVAALVREGSWVGARIDRAQPDRQPLPKPDVRAMLTGVGPVVVFGASNFPLAISVAGTDTVSAFAAGCPVVVKAHPGHPGTSELVASAINKAVARCGLPAGTFSMLHGAGHAIGLALVRHPATRAVAFTGSLRGGRALFDAAVSRPDPIPVYAEMGSLNPVFLLPGALAARAAEVARAFVQSLNMGVGQFCTNPGLLFGLAGDPLRAFVSETAATVAAVPPASMLNAGIAAAYDSGVQRLHAAPGVSVAARAGGAADPRKSEAASILFTTDHATFAAAADLKHEVFGPASLLVTCDDKEQLLSAARALEGHLTAAVHGTEADLIAHRDLIEILATKVGRIIFNGFGTGIEPCPAMHHGGPYPSTTYPAFTSIGHAAIFRYASPVSYQNFPEAALPAALQTANPLGIARVLDGKLVVSSP